MLAPSTEAAQQARELDDLLDEVLVFFQDLDERAVRRRELGWSDYQALRFVGSHDPPAMHHLAEALGLTKGGATRLVDRLERKGAVVRRRDETDGRRAYVELTDRGTELLDNLREDRMDARVRLVTQMGPTAREHVVSALRTLRHAVRQIDDSDGD